MNKFERFAIAMSVLLFEIRIEDLNNSVLFDDDQEQIPSDFIDSILDDPEHQKQIKERLRLSVLEDVTARPDEYDMNGNDYVYSGDIYDHASLVDHYIEEQYAETQSKTTYICMHCNSDNVQVKAWVRPNLGMQYVDEVNEGDEMGWCDDCNLSAVIETGEVKRRDTVIGFQVCGEDGTKEEGKIHPHMKSLKHVYSLDQANSMLDDDNNGDEQWNLSAIWKYDIEEPVMMFEGNPRD
jgi:hypothetical protein